MRLMHAGEQAKVVVLLLLSSTDTLDLESRWDTVMRCDYAQLHRDRHMHRDMDGYRNSLRREYLPHFLGSTLYCAVPLVVSSLMRLI